MAFGTRAAFEAVRELAFGSITTNYAAVGTALTDHARIVIINNTTDKDVYFSLDGVIDHLRVAAGGFKLLDVTSNKVQDDGNFFRIGTIFSVKQTSAGAPSSGLVWVEVCYSQGGV